MDDPQSVDEWLTLARQHEDAALALVRRPNTRGQAIFHAAIAVECSLKALIMRRRGLNRWPTRKEARELWSHDLAELAAVAGISVEVNDDVAPAWVVILQWNRQQGYDPNPVPAKVAKGYVEAAFSEKGVVPWLCESLMISG